jgi:hypothetical protein
VPLLSLIAMVILARSSFVMGTIYHHAFPTDTYVGSISPDFLYGVSALLVAGGLLSLLPVKAVSNYCPDSSVVKHRITLLFAGLFMVVAGFASAIFFWYPAQALGFTTARPLGGIVAFNVFVFLSAIVLLKCSRKNSLKRPNLMRIIVLLCIVFCTSLFTMVLSFILLYTPPFENNTVYATLASGNFVSYVVWGIVILIMTRQRIKISKESH